MSIIGENIQRLRKLRGLTQEELAKLMGYKSKSTINKIELGVNDIPQRKIEKFADVLGATPAEIMGWSIPEAKGAINMFWQRFYVLCKQENSTPSAIAKKLSISSGAVTAWKNGRTPSSAMLQLIADYFGVTVDFLLGKEEQAARSSDSIFTLSKEEREILLTFRENEIFRAAITNIMRLMNFSL